MAKTRYKRPSTEIEFVDPPLPRSTVGSAWLPTLTPLLKAKGRWAKVKEFDNPEHAHNAQSNLHRRRIRIPEPTHDWGFAARGCELYAIYRGPSRPVKRRTRSK